MQLQAPIAHIEPTGLRDLGGMDRSWAVNLLSEKRNRQSRREKERRWWKKSSVSWWNFMMQNDYIFRFRSFCFLYQTCQAPLSPPRGGAGTRTLFYRRTHGRMGGGCRQLLEPNAPGSAWKI